MSPWVKTEQKSGRLDSRAIARSLAQTSPSARTPGSTSLIFVRRPEFLNHDKEPNEEAVLFLLFGLLRSGQIKLRRIVGCQDKGWRRTSGCCLTSCY